MAETYFSERNLKFLLYDVFDLTGLTQYEYYGSINRTLFDMILDAGINLANELYRPNLEEMDKKQPQLKGGKVIVHPSVRAIMKEAGDGGWIASNFPFEFDGEQLPHMITGACKFIFSAANYSGSIYPELTAGAARLITSFGKKDLVNTYVPKMLNGQWQGTMALTEPQAGSSLSDITTTAIPCNEGHYNIKGQKTFISAGDHDGADNVIHLMLAKIEGAPPGVKGISLFVVPKKRLNGKGELLHNDVVVASIYHKLGYRGTPITELSLGEKDDCQGYLVGEPNKGLFYMFKMMNEQRLGVGLGATGIASASYHAALKYAKERPQGRTFSQKDPAKPQIPIVEHADVKRMLLFQRAVVEGSLSLIMQCSFYLDMSVVSSGNEKEKYELLLDILTPIAKTYPSEMGILSTSQSLQCFGGYGYCDDFPVEQYFRDMRIHPIHEGTTGIQGIDLLGRKVVMQDGKAFDLFMAQVLDTISCARIIPGFESYAAQLADALEDLKTITLHKTGLAREKGMEIGLADATLYLEFFGIITIAWQWLIQAVSIQKVIKPKNSKADHNFYHGKLYTFEYYFRYELPKIEGLSKRLMDNHALTVEMKPDFFTMN